MPKPAITTAAFENVLTIIGQVQQRYNIDPHQIYIGGMSNGGTATFWYACNAPDIFAGFYAFSPYPELKVGATNYTNISKGKPLYTLNAKDDGLFDYNTVHQIYEWHKAEARDWHFESAESGGHGIIYNDNGVAVIKSLLDKMMIPQKCK